LAEKNLHYLIPAVILWIFGVFFILTGIFVPADTTQFEYQQPDLAWIVFVSPSSAGVLGTGPQAQQLQIVIGIICLAVGYLLYRRA